VFGISNTYQDGTDIVADTLILFSPVSIRDGTNMTVRSESSFAHVVAGGQELFSGAAIPPVPEPSSLALLTIGIPLALVQCRKQCTGSHPMQSLESAGHGRYNACC
jgi:hypothetical protein